MRKLILVAVMIFSSMNIFSQWSEQQFSPDYNSVYFVPGTSVGYAVGKYINIIRKSSDGGSTWNNLSSVTTEIMNDIFFINQNTGWAVSSSGTILYTTNGGTNFITQTSGLTSNLYTVQFLDVNTGYIAALSGEVLKTTNAGTNWSIVNIPGSSLFGSFFLTPNIGWVGSFSGAVYMTTNGGSNWTTQTCPSGNSIEDIYFTDNQTGWCCDGSGNKIFKTTNAGTNWIQQISASSFLYSIFFNNANTGFACGGGYIYKTTNSGINWNVVFSNINTNTISISPLDANNIVGVGYGSYVLKTTNTGSNWNILTGSNSGDIESIYFTTTSTGYALNSYSYLFKTQNGGANWNEVHLPISNATDVVFANASTGWVAGSISTLDAGTTTLVTLKTTNGGTNWIQYNPPAIITSIADMCFASPTNGWLLGTNTENNSSGTTTYLFNTNNGGVNWSNQYIFTDYARDLYFTSTTEGWACGDNGKVYKTNNGGINWVQQTTPNSVDLYSIYFLNSSQGYACGGAGVIIGTTNGGTTWNLLNSGTTAYLYSIHFGSSTNGVCVGENGVRLRTVNSGASWSNSQEPVLIDLHAAYMVSANNAYVGGEYGYIANLGGIVAINGNENEIPLQYNLSQNYPNPFNPETKITYQLPKGSMVKLIVYDITGRVVNELINKTQSAGNYEVIFNAAAISSGIYFYRLETDEFTETKKMILIK